MSKVEYVGISTLLSFIHPLSQKSSSEESNRLDSRRIMWVVPVVFGFVIWIVTRGKAA